MDILTHDDMSQAGDLDGALSDGHSGGRTMLDWAALKEATKCLKSVAHPVRLRMLELLSEGEYTVGELADLCEVEPSSASDHLGRLRDRGLLTQDRQGKQVYYQIAAPAVDGIVHCMRSNFGPDADRSQRRCGN
jgi:DNA-binding transcriptional ArsR family regulator